ncbi:MAG TPA: glycoside hydrolase family 97 C-terminal domain-containing protein, partial [Cyclobacteriaceae bacterium]|nr:glycoside hydrolase family 97 C-terminal domain-containing protein [Cyclobacteriaceae bacterium]
ARQVEIDFSFLPEGDYFAEVLRDNEFSDVNAKILTREVIVVNSSSTRTINLTKAGGAVLRINNLVTSVGVETKSTFTVSTDLARTRLTIRSDDNLDTIYIVNAMGRVYE